MLRVLITLCQLPLLVLLTRGNSCLVLQGPGAAKFLKSKSTSHASLDLPLGPALFILHNNGGVFSPQSENSFSISLLLKVCAVLSHVQLFVTLLPVACQAPLSMGFFRQGYWSGLPFPPPGGLPDPGTEPLALMPPALAGGFFTTLHHLGSPPVNVTRAHFKGR